MRERLSAKPFMKWAGGKTQLLGAFERRFPPGLGRGPITRYIEPFVGGGAVFFSVARRCRPCESFLFDINEELILVYTVVKRDVENLIDQLALLESAFLPLDAEGRGLFYYGVRGLLNRTRPEIDFSRYSDSWTQRAAQLLFLNRTCYNGLFRVNRRGDFNVPFGRYKRPRILDADNLRAVSRLLEHTEVSSGDFTACEPLVDERTFVYIDPPYRPLNETSRFTSYSRSRFDDQDQIRLAEFCRVLDRKGAKVMISNSDPKNEDPGNDFFDELYAGFTIERVPARRAINCRGKGRGPLNELIITNYSHRAGAKQD
ncbi:methyl-directed repair dna adenine methylase [hydrocarbon metagenome]|uniref:site-specific DNA-methyltransferase (adenine-specific) n=1 Tax=hydrocarbon metagenome TaxID=938273 RepID=A0A0W8FDX8_9ZZZZ